MAQSDTNDGPDKDKPKGNTRRHANDVTEHRIEEEGSTLTASELKEVDHRMKLRPLAVYEIVRQEGEDELTRSNRSLLWSGLAAGLSCVIAWRVFRSAFRSGRRRPFALTCQTPHGARWWSAGAMRWAFSSSFWAASSSSRKSR